MTWVEVWDFAAKHWLQVGFGLLAAAGTAAYRYIIKRIQKDQAIERAVQAGVMALLADRMIQLRNFYADKGYCPVYARRSAEAMYKAYHDLGGNGAITDVFGDLKSLPMEKKESAL